MATRTHTDATASRLGEIHGLRDDEVRVAISYLEQDLDNKECSAKVGVVILLVAIMIAFATLFFHVANR